MSVQILWFRNDLRTKDNHALSTAVASGKPVIAIYLLCTKQWQQHHLAPIQADLILRRLAQLQDDLASLNIPLLVHQLDSFKQVPQSLVELCEQYQAADVHCHYQYELNELRRDEAVEHILDAQQISFHQHHGECVMKPGTVLTRTGESFKVFTPFRKAWLSGLTEAEFSPLATPPAVDKHLLPASFVELLKSKPLLKCDYPLVDSSHWACDDKQIIQQLRDFSASKAADYKAARDFPAQAGTSKLSAYLALGMLSPRQCLARIYLDHPRCLEAQEGGTFTWLSEIVWREFYRHLIAANPRLCKGQAYIAWTEAVNWQHDEQLLKAWQEGRTGYPIVDAAMLQLKQTGWMHNRLRMIVASFLTKDLLVSWREGERWFMQHLIDGDFASNNGGWQWAASTGTDAQPYFRIFNPTTQAQRFDPNGDFVRYWLPELAEVPGKHAHQPHTWAEKNATSVNYPMPIVDHAIQRKLALSLFEQAKSQAQS
ncbi:deoxyribodipyrimidine photo-lyase [Agarivorans sp. 1_MG-2023]|uniref:deoxyribodipyrimidine photo-lyase n=1 Tax=Agarivorans sp. 1_MG-2023 TaxID=3062634 RepID=UPI0026E2F1BA|nr:deoxyribodipyrimidine photo-lyase [Agarivorans sp. 1_MG-2023]MDO6762502.1 deoxyribodipyrimidine photo-lyase [Agarivorans sp. 1_MG-2023]